MDEQRKIEIWRKVDGEGSFEWMVWDVDAMNASWYTKQSDAWLAALKARSVSTELSEKTKA